MNTLLDGDYFGFESWQSQSQNGDTRKHPRSATIVCVGRCDIYNLPQFDFEEVMELYEVESTASRKVEVLRVCCKGLITPIIHRNAQGVDGFLNNPSKYEGRMSKAIDLMSTALRSEDTRVSHKRATGIGVNGEQSSRRQGALQRAHRRLGKQQDEVAKTEDTNKKVHRWQSNLIAKVVQLIATHTKIIHRLQE